MNDMTIINLGALTYLSAQQDVRLLFASVTNLRIRTRPVSEIHNESEVRIFTLYVNGVKLLIQLL